MSIMPIMFGSKDLFMGGGAVLPTPENKFQIALYSIIHSTLLYSSLNPCVM